MPTIRAFVLALCTFAALPAAAQDPCSPGQNALGVSRIVEIDTTTGPRFGFQHKDNAFLADGEVVLTFDDGPLRAYTRPVLDALAAHCTRATFFLVGRMAVADPEMVQEYARRGHTVGTHTFSHANLHALTPLRARNEMELGFSAVQLAMGKPIAPFFRFPYLHESRYALLHAQERQFGVFSIDVDSKDYRTRDAASVHRKIMGDLARQRKGILLFHDIQASTARALPGLLADLKAKGFRVVHIQPKAAATTMPEFDALAALELAKRRPAVVAQPLAKRSLTWSGHTKPATEPAAAQPATRLPRSDAPGSDKVEWPLNLWKW